MSLIQNKCIVYNERRAINVATEKGKTYRLNNHSNLKIRKVRVDKCVSQNHGEMRCDFLFNTEEKKQKNQVFFVELKGRGIGHALKQLYQTIVFLKPDFKDHLLNARIVGSKDTPGFTNIPDYKKLKNEVQSSGGTIERSTNKFYSENI